MGKTEIIALAVLAGVALYFYSDIKKALQPTPWTQSQTKAAIVSAGGNVVHESTGDYWKVDGGVVKLQDNWTPNFAQKLLVGLDKIVPSDWLTRKVFGV